MSGVRTRHYQYKQRKKVLFYVLLAGVFLANIIATAPASADVTPNGDGSQTVSKQEQANLKVNGRVGEMNPSTTNPTDPNVPGVGMDWIQVKLPLRAGYYSTAESQHKRIDSNTFKVDNLSAYPVSISLSGFVGADGTSAPVTTGVESLKMNLDKTSIPLVTGGAPAVFNGSDKSAPVYTLGAGSSTPAPGSFKGPASGTFSFSGTTQSNIDVSKAIVLNNQLNFTLTGLDGDGNVPKDQTSITVHDSKIELGQSWTAADNFDGGKDQFGANLPLSKVTVGGDKVDTSKVGIYSVSYTYRKVTQVAKIKVLDPNRPILNSDGSISFMKMKWDVIRKPDTLGTNNYLIAMQKSIQSMNFNSSTTYFTSNTDSLDGYQSSDVKLKIDSWYNQNIKGQVYEKFIQPVSLLNATLGDMKKSNYGGWSSNTRGDGTLAGFKQLNNPNAFPTKVDNVNGTKQAFLMSGSDVSNGQGNYADFTNEALHHRDILATNGITASWLRSPGLSFDKTALITKYGDVSWDNVDHSKDVIPSLIVNLDL